MRLAAFSAAQISNSSRCRLIISSIVLVMFASFCCDLCEPRNSS